MSSDPSYRRRALIERARCRQIRISQRSSQGSTFDGDGPQVNLSVVLPQNAEILPASSTRQPVASRTLRVLLRRSQEVERRIRELRARSSSSSSPSSSPTRDSSVSIPPSSSPRGFRHRRHRTHSLELVINLWRNPEIERRVQELAENQQSNVHPLVTSVGGGLRNLPRPVPVVTPRRRHAEIPHRQTYLLALRTQNIEAVQRHDLGNMTSICRHCHAKFFTGERAPLRETGRFLCCNFGKVVLPPLRQCPAELRRLLTDDNPVCANYRENIRSANSLFAMASFKAKIPENRNQDQGTWCFHVCGQIYHYIEPIPSQGNSNAINNNYYFLDAEDAIERRAAFVGDRLNHSTLELLENLLRRVNPWIKSYMTMREAIEDYRRIHPDRNAVDNIIVAFKDNMNDELRTHALPTSRSDVAAVFIGEEPPFDVHLKLYPRAAGHRHELKNLSVLADPMVYPLLFPFGEKGYDQTLRHTYEAGHARRITRDRGEVEEIAAAGAATLQTRVVTIREFYRYRLQCRDFFSILHNSGKLFQQYIVDAWVRAEANDLWFIKQHQKELRVADYTSLRRYLEQRARRANATVGRIVVLPPGFTGSPRDRRRKYLDGMALVARYGKPDLFITMTCNPRWPEIQSNLEHKQKYEHRPDLVCRVFHSKLLELMDDLVNKQYFGVLLSYMYVIEFQKRGLPHAHILLTLRPEDKLDSEDAVDNPVCACIPDEETEPRMYNFVKQHYIHRPCGPISNPTAPCMSNGICTKAYPKRLREHTALIGNNSIRQPDYKRPADGRTIEYADQLIDNSRIIPHNKLLTAKYDCHMNVECCGSIESIKYLHKYVEKGADYITIQARQEENVGNVIDWDEVRQYQDYRYVSSTEALWRLFEYQLSDRSHSVMTLPVHLPNEQEITFDENQAEEEIINIAERSSKLMAWFSLNMEDVDARRLKYVQVPEYYTWNTGNNRWVKRRQISKMIGSLGEVSMLEGERYFLRLLLKVTPGAISFENLRTINGRLFESFEAAARALHLVNRPDTYIEAMREVAHTKNPFFVRDMFGLCIVSILTEDVGREAIRPMYDEFQEYMIRDFIHNNNDRIEVAQEKALYHIKRYLERSNLRPVPTLVSLGLPSINIDEDALRGQVPVTYNEFIQNVIEYDRSLRDRNDVNNNLPWPGAERAIREVPDIRKLNNGQIIAFNRIVSAINDYITTGQTEKNVFYVDGPGGTGKTFLYNVIQSVTTKIFVATYLAVAWTGMAATLLKHGKTVHSTFRLPLNLRENTVAGFDAETEEGQRIKSAVLIIWDEASMAPRKAVLAIDRYLRRLMANDTLMGGKIVVFGGDFRQLLPVIPGAHAAEIVAESIQALPFWPQVEKLRLQENMRHRNASNIVRESEENILFPDYLLKIGNGTVPYKKMTSYGAPQDLVEVPAQYLVRNEHDLLNFVYGDGVFHNIASTEKLSVKAILCPKNSSVKEMNSIILESVPGEAKTYYAVDTYCADPDDELHIPDDLLNSIDSASLPPFELRIKVGAVVMLLRNMDIESGLCNGTRLIVREMGEFTLTVEVISGPGKGRIINLPKVTTKASEGTGLPKPMLRKQFPVKLAYAMTINKAQGQTFEKVGIYLETPCFSHGQLYVAMSRVGLGNNLKIYIKNGPQQGPFKYRNGKIFTRNVVYRNVVEQQEILQCNSARERELLIPEHMRNTRNNKDDDDNNDEDHEPNNFTYDMELLLEALEDDLRTSPVQTLSIGVNLDEQSTQRLRTRISVGERPGTSGIYFTKPHRPVDYDSDSD